jgi:hypothetical protein
LSTEITGIIQAAIPTAVGLGGFIWGIHTYRQGQNLKRKEILFPLIEEFDKTEDHMVYAKKLLHPDGFSIFLKDEKQEKNIGPYYGGQALDTILRIHGELIFRWDNIPGVDEFHLKQFLNEKLTLEWIKDAGVEKLNNWRGIRLQSGNDSVTIILDESNREASVLLEPSRYLYKFIIEESNGMFNLYEPTTITDYGEIQIRESFSALLDFFGKLEYLMERGLIQREDLRYFEYYINKAKDDKAVRLFADYYNFDLYKELLRKL